MRSDDENPADTNILADEYVSADQTKSGQGISWREALTAVGLALAIPWMIGVPILLGWWIDQKYQTRPIGFIVGLVVGLVGTAVDIVKLLRRFGQIK